MYLLIKPFAMKTLASQVKNGACWTCSAEPFMPRHMSLT